MIKRLGLTITDYSTVQLVKLCISAVTVFLPRIIDSFIMSHYILIHYIRCLYCSIRLCRYVGLNGPLACNINLQQVTNVTYLFTAGNSGLMATQVKLEVIGYGSVKLYFPSLSVKVCDFVVLWYARVMHWLFSSILLLSIFISEKTLRKQYSVQTIVQGLITLHTTKLCGVLILHTVVVVHVIVWGLYPYCCKPVHSLARTLYLFKVWRINRVIRKL